MPDRAIDLPADRAEGVVHVALGFDFAEYLAGELKVAFFQRLGGALQPRPGTFGIEKLDGLVAQRLVKRVAEIAGTGKAVIWNGG